MNLNEYLIAQSLQYLQWLEFNSWEISWWVMQTSIECHLLPQVSQTSSMLNIAASSRHISNIYLDVREQQAWLIFHLHALATKQNDRDRRTPMLPRRFHLRANLHHPVNMSNLLFMILIVTDRRYIIRIIFKSIIFFCWCSMKLSSFSFCSVISEKGLHYYDLILRLSHSLQPQS